MPVITALRDIFHRVVDAPAADHDLHLTVAILLTLVAQADGSLRPVERRGLEVMLGARFGLSPAATDSLMREVAKAGGGIDPATTLIERIRHDVPAAERARLLALAYRVAAIDGIVHDFEDDLIWRTGRHLGFSDGDLSAIKTDAVKNLAKDVGA